MAFDHPVQARKGTKYLSVDLTLDGKAPTSAFVVFGELVSQAVNQTGDYATDFGVGNQHICLTVNTITGTGDITITGTSVTEGGATVTASDTEVLSVDATAGQRWQSSKKWWDVQNIDIPAGISAIDYDIEICGYLDFGNEDTTLLGYRLDVVLGGSAPELSLRIRKVQDDGGGKMSIVNVEDIGLDLGGGGAGIVDNLRTAGDDRSYTSTELLAFASDGGKLDIKTTDLSTYFSSDENVFECAAKDEGILIDLRGQPTSGDLRQIDRVFLELFFGQP